MRDFSVTFFTKRGPITRWYQARFKAQAIQWALDHRRILKARHFNVQEA